MKITSTAGKRQQSRQLNIPRCSPSFPLKTDRRASELRNGMKISCAFVFRKLREQQIDHTEDFLSSIVIISQFGSKSAVIMTCGQIVCREKTMHLAILILRMCCCYFECVVQLKS